MYLHANVKLGLAGRLALDKAVEEGLSLKAAADKVDDVAQPVEVRRRAQQQTPASQQRTEAPERDVDRHGRVLDDLGEEDRAKAPVGRRVVAGEIPLDCIDSVDPLSGETTVMDVGSTARSVQSATAR